MNELEESDDKPGEKAKLVNKWFRDNTLASERNYKLLYPFFHQRKFSSHWRRAECRTLWEASE